MRRARALIHLAVLLAVVIGPPWAAAAPVPADDEAALARAYAPVMRFKEQPVPCGAGEAYRPIDVDLILGNAEVALRGPWDTTSIIGVAPTAEDLSPGLPGYALDFPGDALDPACSYEELASRVQAGQPAGVYARVARQPGEPGRIALQYWFFYLFNDFTNKHEGDWEMVQLLFEAADAAQALESGPVEVGYSQHDGGERAEWGAAKLEIEGGTHPVVYPASGSHANYYSSALFLGRSSSQGFGCDDTTGPSVTERPTVLTIPADPARARATYPWLGFEGHWGERHTAFYDGPTGPNTKRQWTEPVAWARDTLRSQSFAVPAGGVAGTTATGFFCTAVSGGSDVVRRMTANPWPVLAVIAALILLLLWATTRTRWEPSAPLRVGRRRAWGQVLSATARMYGGHPRLFLGIGLLFIPVGALAALAQYLLFQLGTFAPLVAVAGRASALTAALAVALGAVFVLLAYALVIAATARAMAELDAGRAVSARTAYRLSLDAIGPLLGALAMAVATQAVLGLTVVLAPVALFLLVRWSLLAVVIELEDHEVRGSLRRSGALTRGHWWRVLSLVIGVAGAALLVGPLVGALALVLTGASFALVNLLAALVYVLVMPFAAIIAVYVYFDLRVREEVEPPAIRRLDHLPSEMPDAPPPAAVASPAAGSPPREA